MVRGDVAGHPLPPNSLSPAGTGEVLSRFGHRVRLVETFDHALVGELRIGAEGETAAWVGAAAPAYTPRVARPGDGGLTEEEELALLEAEMAA